MREDVVFDRPYENLYSVKARILTKTARKYSLYAIVRLATEGLKPSKTRNGVKRSISGEILKEKFLNNIYLGSSQQQ